MKIQISYDILYLNCGEKRRMREYEKFYERNGQFPRKEVEMTSLEELVLESFLIGAFPEVDCDELENEKLAMMEFYNGNFDILPGESENLWRMFVDYSRILYLFLKDYNSRNEELDEEEIEVREIPKLGSMDQSVVVNDTGYGGGVNNLRDHSVVSDFLLQVKGMEAISRGELYSASSYEFYRIGNNIFPRSVRWASNRSKLVIIELLYNYCDDDTNRTLSVVDSGANSRYLSEINRRISEMKSVGHYPVDKFIRRIDKYSFKIPYGDWWLKSNYIKKIYCDTHGLIGCPCLGKIQREDIEYVLRKALIKRFSKYTRLERISIGNGFSRLSLEIVSKVNKSGSLIMDVDKWIYQLLSYYSEFSYWVGSLRRSYSACKSVELIWLMGYSQCYLLCPNFFEIYRKYNNQYGCSVREIPWNGFVVRFIKRSYRRVFQKRRSSRFEGSIMNREVIFL